MPTWRRGSAASVSPSRLHGIGARRVVARGKDDEDPRPRPGPRLGVCRAALQPLLPESRLDRGHLEDPFRALAGADLDLEARNAGVDREDDLLAVRVRLGLRARP